MPLSCFASVACQSVHRGDRSCRGRHWGCSWGDSGHWLKYLDQVVDHQSRQGLRCELGFLLAVVVAATVCAGHDDVAAQAQWAADAPEWVLTALGAKPDPLTGMITAPSESTLRRTPAGVDTDDYTPGCLQDQVRSAVALGRRLAEDLVEIVVTDVAWVSPLRTGTGLRAGLRYRSSA